MFVLDTNVVSELRRGRRADPRVIDWVDRHPEEQLYLTAVTVYEIRLGILQIPRRDRRQVKEFEDWFAGVLDAFAKRILVLDAVGAVEAAQARHQTSIDLKDCMIGAIANRNDMTVATRNVRQLSRIARRTIDPWSGAAG